MKEKIKSLRQRYKNYEPFIFFTAGFLFDVFTLRRIDDWLKLIFQIIFLSLLALFLIFQYREEKEKHQFSGVGPEPGVGGEPGVDGKPAADAKPGAGGKPGVEEVLKPGIPPTHAQSGSQALPTSKAGPKPPRFLSKIWPYQIEIVHFMFGSMLSAFVIFYFKSASLTRSVIFLFLLVALLVLNELPRIREYGVRLRYALYSFCLASFFIYFLPVVFGFINWLLFFGALILAALLMWALVSLTTRGEPREEALLNRQKLGVPALIIYLVLLASYLLKIIPPVPLSMTYGGIYHKVEKNALNGKTELYSLRPWYNFWGHGDSVFRFRTGDAVYCFVRIFAPARFGHTVLLEWFLEDARGNYVLQDKIPMEIKGGREEGFRGYVYKSHFQPGNWRVDVETQDERVIGNISFKVEEDQSQDDRIWMIEEG